jgi:hypothetical protein
VGLGLFLSFRNNIFLRGGVVSLTPNPQPGGLGYPFLSGSSPLTCLACVFVLHAEHYLGHKVKEDEIGRACDTRPEEEMHVGFFSIKCGKGLCCINLIGGGY